MPNTLRNLTEWLIDFSGIIGFLLLWEFIPRTGIVDPQFIPPLSQVCVAIIKLATGEGLFLHIAASLQRTFIGIILAVAIAVPAGFVLGGVFPILAQYLRPLMRLLGQINAFSLFPIFILFFGIGEFAKVSIIFWSSLWPVLFTTIAGVQQVDPLYIKSARSMGANRLILFSQVILPGAAPAIFTGIRSGTSHGFLMLIAAEMIGAKAGLGWIILNSAANSLMPRLFAATIIIALLGMIINYFIHWLEGTLLDWKQEVG